MAEMPVEEETSNRLDSLPDDVINIISSLVSLEDLTNLYLTSKRLARSIGRDKYRLLCRYFKSQCRDLKQNVDSDILTDAIKIQFEALVDQCVKKMVVKINHVALAVIKGNIKIFEIVYTHCIRPNVHILMNERPEGKIDIYELQGIYDSARIIAEELNRKEILDYLNNRGLQELIVTLGDIIIGDHPADIVHKFIQSYRKYYNPDILNGILEILSSEITINGFMDYNLAEIMESLYKFGATNYYYALDSGLEIFGSDFFDRDIFSSILEDANPTVPELNYSLKYMLHELLEKGLSHEVPKYRQFMKELIDRGADDWETIHSIEDLLREGEMSEV